MKLSKSTTVLASSVLLLSLSQPAYATHFSGGFASASSLTYVNGNGSTWFRDSAVKIAAQQWDNASNSVGLTYSTASGTYGYTASIVVYDSTSTDPNAFGETFPYKSFTGASASPGTTTDTWVKVSISIYTNNLSNSETQETTTHEMGHALSIAHSSGTTEAIMTPNDFMGRYTLYSYDINSLRAKWGN